MTTVEGVELRHCAAEELLPTLADSSIDLILTDPPYFRVVDESWDRDHKSEAAFLDWIGWLCSEWARVLRPNGSLYVFASADRSWKVAARVSVFFEVLNLIRWEKQYHHDLKSPDDQRRRYSSPWEACIFAEHKGSDSTAQEGAGYAAACDELRGHVFDPIRLYLSAMRYASGRNLKEIYRDVGSTVAQHAFSRSQWSLPTSAGYAKLRAYLGDHLPWRSYDALKVEYDALKVEYDALKVEYENRRRPFFADRTKRPRVDLWTYAPPPSGDDRHPCEKPVDMLRDIIETSTRPGALILDCFAGSASTGCAAIHTKRRAIMCERDAKWYGIGAENLSRTAARGIRGEEVCADGFVQISLFG